MSWENIKGDFDPVVNDQGEIVDINCGLSDFFWSNEHQCYQFVGDELRAILRFPREKNFLLDLFCLMDLPDSFFVYPLGDLAKEFIGLASGKKKILGVLDRGLAGSKYGELNVYHPDCRSLEDRDVVLLHHTREGFLKDTLVSQGVPEKNIHGSYGTLKSNAVESVFDKWCEVFFSGFEFGWVKNVIVSSHANIGFLGDKYRDCFDVKDTLVFYVGNPDFLRSDVVNGYRVINAYSSYFLICDAIKRIKPAGIYVATLHADNYWAMLLDQDFPGLVFSHEIYDWSLTYPVAKVKSLHSSSSMMVFYSRVGEVYSSRYVKKVVSKRGGREWQRLYQQIQGGNYWFYFSSLPVEDVSERQVKCSRVERTVVYAGPVPPEIFSSDWDIYEYGDLFKDLGVRSDIVFYVYNSFHFDERQDAMFSELQQLLGCRYSKRIELSALISCLKEYDYGWMAINKKDYLQRCPDAALVYSARLVAYLAAGIPVIVDSTWKAIVELVVEFNAGIVVDIDEDFVGEILEKWAPQEHSKGAVKLKQYMCNHNAEFIGSLMRNLSELKYDS